MTALGGFGVPGVGSLDQTYEQEVLWGGDNGKGIALFKSAVIDGSARDAGNTPTTVLRPGLLLGKVTATGKLKQWDNAAVDGTETVYGVLLEQLKVVDEDGNNVDRVLRVLVWGPIKVRALLIQGAAFVGHADEAAARTELKAKNFMLDDEY